MVVVTTRLRATVAPSQKIQEAYSHTVPVSAAAPYDDEDLEILQETSADPTHTYFKPYSEATATSSASALTATRSQSILVTFSWIASLVTLILIGLVAYQLVLAFPFYRSTVLPIPTVGLFQSTSYQLPRQFATLPALPATLRPTTLNLSPFLLFPAK